jgi:hypothetical protein
MSLDYTAKRGSLSSIPGDASGCLTVRYSTNCIAHPDVRAILLMHASRAVMG